MKKLFLIITLSLLLAPFSILKSQVNVQSLDTVQAPAGTTTNYIKPLYHDSLSSSFVIIVPKEVKKHLHATHSEQVYVISGEADMTVGDKNFHIKAGDIIFIPKGTPHSAMVTSKEPLKILSVQSPYFDGKDRVMLDK
ncbi:MAG: cupin domain-containing protein [Bacteroidetes bacterium]|nr:cupin domain-containing protein [Bacteroidota bacterium]